MSTSEAHPYKLEILGPFRISRNGRPVSIRPAEQRLIAVLAVQGAASRQDAAATLWPGSERNRAQANLRTVLSRLRIDAPGLVHEDGKVLHLQDAQVDLQHLRAWSASVVAADSSPTTAPSLLALGRDLLATWDEPWLVQSREELKVAEVGALEAMAQRLIGQNKLSLASSYAHAAVRIDPIRESSAHLLIDIHLRQGNTAAALQEFQRVRQEVHEATGAQPSPSLISLIANTGVLNFAGSNR